MIYAGLTAQILLSVWAPLQLWRVLRAPSVEGVSITAIGFLGFGNVLLFAYAVSINDPVFSFGSGWFAALTLAQVAVVLIRRRLAPIATESDV